MIIIKCFVSNLQSYTFRRNPPKHSQNFLIIKEKTSKNLSPSPAHPSCPSPSIRPVSPAIQLVQFQNKNQDPQMRILILSF